MSATKVHARNLSGILGIGRVAVDVLNRLIFRLQNGLTVTGAIGDGTTDGELRTTAAVHYQIAGQLYTKAATDDLWDLKAEVDTIALKYRAYALYLDDAGAASFAAHGATDADSAAEALTALQDVVEGTEEKALIGVYVAGPETDFNGAAGLAAQGDIYDGWPAALEVQQILLI